MNKDHYFDENNDDVLDVNDANSPSGKTPSIADGSHEANSTNDLRNQSSHEEVADGSHESNSTNTLRKQVSRIEAKLDFFQNVMQQIQRTVISLTNGANVDVSENAVLNLPLTTEDSINKFDADLNEITFRQSVVRYLTLVIVSLINPNIKTIRS